jgi:hypothetical protein
MGGTCCGLNVVFKGSRDLTGEEFGAATLKDTMAFDGVGARLDNSLGLDFLVLIII